MTRMRAARRIGVVLVASAVTLGLSACSATEARDTALQLPGKAAQALDAGLGKALSAISAPTIEEAKAGTKLSPKVTSPDIHENGVLTVGLESSASVPMLVSSSDGGHAGYNVDVAHALADELGLTVSFVSVGDASQADSASCDIVMGAEAGNSGSMTVVGSYAEAATAFFHKGAEGTVERGAIMGKTVGLQESSLSQQLLKRSDLQAAAKTYSNLNDAFAALESGSVDYVLCDAYSGAYLQAGYPDIALAGSVDAPVSVGVAVNPSNAVLQEQVTEAFDAMSTNGVLDVLRAKWLGGMCPLTPDTQVQGVTMSSVTPADTAVGSGAEAVMGATGGQDGSTAGANAVNIAG